MQINATFIKIERYTLTQVTFRPAEETWVARGKVGQTNTHENGTSQRMAHTLQLLMVMIRVNCAV
jgi:hypothetical protein